MTLSHNAKGNLTIASGFIIHLACGTLYTFGLLNSFLMSYLKIYDSSIVLDDGFFLLPLGILFFKLCIIIGGRFEHHYGPRLALICGTILITLGYMLIYFTKSIYIQNFSMVVLGLGIGLCYLTPVRTAWKYFPNNRGTTVGTITSGFGLSSLLLSILLIKIINPEGYSPNKDTKSYPKEVASNVPNFILITMIIVFILGLLGILLIQPYKELKRFKALEKNNDNDKELSNYNEDEISIQLEEPIKNKENDNLNTNIEANDGNNKFSKKEVIKEEISKLKKRPLRSYRLLDAIFNKKTLKLSALMYCLMYIPAALLNLMKPFSLYSSDSLSENLVFWIAIVTGFFNFITRYIFGMFFYFSTNLPGLYFIFPISATIVSAGITTIMPATVGKIFGIDNSTEVYGVVVIFYGLSAMTPPIISKIFNYNSEAEEFRFLIIFQLGTILSIIGYILLFSIDEEPYKFYNKLENDIALSKEKDLEIKAGLRTKDINNYDIENK